MNHNRNIQVGPGFRWPIRILHLVWSILLPSNPLPAQSTVSLPEDVVIHLPMNGRAEDQGPHAHRAHISGGVIPGPDRFGNPCGALAFNGIDGRVSIPNSPMLESIRRAFSVSVWVKIASGTPWSDLQWLTICCKGRQAQETPQCPQFRVQATRVTTSINTELTEPSHYSIAVNSWYHYTLTWDGAVIKSFLDGREIFSFNYSGQLTPNQEPLEIGRDIPGETEFFAGTMDDFRLYGRALNPNEVLSLYRADPREEASLSLHCPDTTNLVCDSATCDIPLAFAPPEVNDHCGQVELKQVSGPLPGTKLTAGKYPVSFLATNSTGEQKQCSFTVRVMCEPRLNLACPGNVEVTCPAGKTAVPVKYPSPNWDVDCGEGHLELRSGGASGTEFSVGDHVVEYVLREEKGNETQCNFSIKVAPAPEPSLVCPPNRRLAVDHDRCDVAANYGRPTTTHFGPGTEADISQGPKPGQRIGVGRHEIEYSVSDNHGRRHSCSFSLEVFDPVPPKIECPPQQSFVVPLEAGFAAIQFPKATASDNCQLDSVYQLSGPTPGSRLAAGQYRVGMEARDASGNKSPCQFSILVSPAPAQKIVLDSTDLPSTISQSPNQDTIIYAPKVIYLEGASIRVYYFDNKEQDGDIVSLYFDGTELVAHEKIRAQKKSLPRNRYVDLELEPGKIHGLISQAWNTGRKGPNTLTLVITDQQTIVRRLVLNSQIGRSAAIKLALKPQSN